MIRSSRGGVAASLVCMLVACGAEDASVNAPPGGGNGSGAGAVGGAGGTSSGQGGVGGSGGQGGSECEDGDSQPCYTGDPPATEGVGPCVGGTQVCVGGIWLVCEGEVTPVAESCDGEDESCNGVVDDATELGCGVGTCQVIVAGCDGGQPNECVPLEPAPVEACDGFDDDCDGLVDDGCSCTNGQTQTCYGGPAATAGVGLCVTGEQLCAGGQWSPCADDVIPVIEACNGVDDDCDGAVDEGCPCSDGDSQDCYGGPADTADVGECVQGSQTCAGGAWGDCGGDSTPAVESCDTLDNDCDGQSDQGDPGGGESCDTGLQGVCAAGTTACSGGVLDCEQDVPLSTEVCNGLDDDCDGSADDGDPGGGQDCSTGQPGVCAAGTTSCSGGSVVCSPNQPPTTEVCDGIDNDCAGGVDDGNPGGGQVCDTGQPGICAAGTTACVNASPLCLQDAQPAAEVCDGLDNDCDGTADDGNPGAGQDCDTGLPGICAPGTITCTGGALVCSQDAVPSGEACDGIDNDCDSSVDENPTLICPDLPNASPICSNATCVVNDCDTGFCDANSSDGDGCEHDLDTNPVCTAFTNLGTVSGDTASTTVTWTGSGERWFRVYVAENESGVCAEDLCARITLDPGGVAMDYDLYGYCDDCAGSDASSVNGSGQTDTIYMRWDEDTIWDPFCSNSDGASGSDSGRYLYVNVRMFDVDECNSYTLSVTGDVCGSTNTCSSR